MNRRRAVFFDRDGTLNYDSGYIKDPQNFSLLDGVPEDIKTLNDAGYFLVVLSNQSGIGRGLLTAEDLELIHKKMYQQLEKARAHVDAIYICPHRPEENCQCRKPLPGLLFKATEEFNIDLAQSFLIGDKESDLLAGRNAGCKAVVSVPGAVSYTIKEFKEKPDYSAADIHDAIRWILLQK